MSFLYSKGTDFYSKDAEISFLRAQLQKQSEEVVRLKQEVEYLTVEQLRDQAKLSDVLKLKEHAKVVNVSKKYREKSREKYQSVAKKLFSPDDTSEENCCESPESQKSNDLIQSPSSEELQSQDSQPLTNDATELKDASENMSDSPEANRNIFQQVVKGFSPTIPEVAKTPEVAREIVVKKTVFLPAKTLHQTPMTIELTPEQKSVSLTSYQQHQQKSAGRESPQSVPRRGSVKSLIKRLEGKNKSSSNVSKTKWIPLTPRPGWKEIKSLNRAALLRYIDSDFSTPTFGFPEEGCADEEIKFRIDSPTDSTISTLPSTVKKPPPSRKPRLKGERSSNHVKNMEMAVERNSQVDQVKKTGDIRNDDIIVVHPTITNRKAMRRHAREMMLFY